MTPGALETVAVAAFAAQLRRDEEELRLAVAEAKAAGAPVGAIADAAGVTRQTVYRWLEQSVGASHRADLRETLDAALELLAEHVGDTNRPTLLARLASREIGPKVLGIRIGTSSLPPGFSARATDEERLTITSGTEAAQEALRARDQTGEWPEWVRMGRRANRREG